MKRVFFHYLKPYYARMSVGFIIKFIGTIMDLLLPWTLAHMIDEVIPAKETGQIALWGLFMVVCSILAVTFNIVANRMASRVASDAMFTIRGDLFEKVMHLTNRQIDELTRPSLISRLTSDTYNVHQMLGRIQRLGVRAPILLIGGITMTMVMDPALACVLLATLPLLTVVVVLVSKKSIPMYSQLQERADRFVRLVREDISGIRVIKALSKEDYERKRFDKVNQDVVEQERKAAMITGVTSPAMNILLNLGLVGVILTGAYRVNAGLSEVGTILAFMTYFTIILNALLSVSKMFVMLSKAAASATRIVEVLDAEDESVLGKLEDESGSCAVPGSGEPPMGSVVSAGAASTGAVSASVASTGVVSAGSTSGDAAGGSAVSDGPAYHIEFADVSFSYNKRKNNLEHISFQLKQGETLGIIGATGSGKTTIVNLLLRFYDADEGTIRIGGRDIRLMDIRDLRSRFGVVFQNDVIFEESILENIAMGRQITEEQAKQAAVHARAGAFVEEKGGVKEKLDIRGANLSGGQKQRLLIARALADQPEILVLDDSSSALDYKTDAQLRQELRQSFADTTCIVIAQRISSIMSADHILVLEDGKAIGYGTHEELMKQCEVYREIGASQMGIS